MEGQKDALLPYNLWETNSFTRVSLCEVPTRKERLKYLPPLPFEYPVQLIDQSCSSLDCARATPPTPTAESALQCTSAVEEWRRLEIFAIVTNHPEGLKHAKCRSYQLPEECLQYSFGGREFRRKSRSICPYKLSPGSFVTSWERMHLCSSIILNICWHIGGFFRDKTCSKEAYATRP